MLASHFPPQLPLISSFEDHLGSSTSIYPFEPHATKSDQLDNELFLPNLDSNSEPSSNTNTSTGSSLLPQETTITSTPSQLPVYSSELGGLPVHPAPSSFNEPFSTIQFNKPQSSHFNVYTDPQYQSTSSPPPEIRQYFSLFDDSMGSLGKFPFLNISLFQLNPLFKAQGPFPDGIPQNDSR
jgi:hypothetical protein